MGISFPRELPFQCTPLVRSTGYLGGDLWGDISRGVSRVFANIWRLFPVANPLLVKAFIVCVTSVAEID